MGIDAREIKRQEAMKIWAERIKAKDESGMSAAKWCKENNISLATFNRWKGILNTENGAAKKPKMGGGKTQKMQAKHEPAATQMKSGDGVAASICVNGVNVQIHRGADAATIETLLRAIKG